MRAFFRRSLLAAAALTPSSRPAMAQNTPYPSRPIRLIIPFGAGSTTDILGRLVAQKLGEQLNQSVVAENRAGAGGNIGTEVAARAAADGYTLLLGAASTNAINPSLYSNLRFDPIGDFVPVIHVASVTNVLVVHPDLPAQDVPGLIALAKRQDLSYASGGAGGTIHLSGELFKHLAGVEMVHVPYNGSAAAHADLLSGRVPMMFDSIATCLPHVQAGRLRALAVTAPYPSPLLPGIKPLAEAGLPGYAVEGWYGLFAPAGTPEPIIGRLNSVLRQALSEPATQQLLQQQGAQQKGDTPERFRTFVLAERDKWAALIKAAGITQN
jgi:tripartite-type tricarboxylate transporter receptor subunit TctC